MNASNPYFGQWRAGVQSTHLLRRTALELRQSLQPAPTVSVEGFKTERTLLLQDGRRVDLWFLTRAAPDRRPSRRRLQELSAAIRGTPARLVTTNTAGAGLQCDLAYEIIHPELLTPLRLLPNSVLDEIVPLYITLGITIVSLGLAEVDQTASSKDRIVAGHLRLLRAAQADAQRARVGIWAAPDPDLGVIRRLIEP